MNFSIPTLTLNQRLAVFALGLGFLAILGGTPQHTSKGEVDVRELALSVDQAVDHVNAEELADWIITGKADYRLLDLRSEKEFDEYHIPPAENVAVAGLLDYPLLRNEKIVLYSGGGIHSAQAWFLLRSRGYKGVYILMGGLEEWQDRVLFPKLPENATGEQMTAFEKMKHVSAFFDGQPQTGISEEKSKLVMVMPKLDKKSSGGQAKTGKKKKKEGC